jgi:hypothetical protein
MITQCSLLPMPRSLLLTPPPLPPSPLPTTRPSHVSHARHFTPPSRRSLTRRWVWWVVARVRGREARCNSTQELLEQEELRNDWSWE